MKKVRKRNPSLTGSRYNRELQQLAEKGNFSEQEKKRLQAFLGEILRVGCLKGFKYFALYLRGREELICRVLNEPMSQEILSYYTSPTSENRKTGKSSFSFDSPHTLPRNDQSLIMSANTQKSLSGYGFMDIGLPPASPSERDIDLKDDKSTLFLIAAYARYNCPYVWVRSNHERLVSFTGGGDESKLRDSPLKLKSTTTWKLNDTKLWDITGEIVKLCMYPAPLNPFAIDFQYFEGLPLGERLIATGAMVSFLQKVVSSGDHVYNARVFDDLGELARQHFKDLQTFSRQQKSKEISARQQGMTQQPAQYYQAGPMQSYHTHYQAY